MVMRVKGVWATLGPVTAIAVLLSAVAAPAAQADGAAAFRHGIGISHVMAWAQIKPGPAREFAFPPFADVGGAQFAEQMQTLRQTGFDFVRLAVDPGPFLQFEGARRDFIDRLLIDRVRQILAARLAVIVDFHPSDMHPAYTGQALTAGITTAAFQAYLRLLERTVGLLDELHSDKIALELMNEPPVRPSVWQPLADAAYAAARSRSAKLLLILEGGDEASAAGLVAMKTDLLAKDPAVLFSFHYYDPYQFTHQGASWNPARYLADVPYPARARPLEDSLTATAAAIAASDLPEPGRALAYRDAQTRLESYRNSGFDAGTIARSFQQLGGWARSQGVAPSRIMLGEFGARKTALQDDGGRAAERTQWFHDVSEAAENQSFGWAVWTYRAEGGFGLTRSEASDDIEPGIAEALGLRRRPRADAAPAGFDAMSETRR